MVRRGCLLSLAIWLALAAAYFVFFTRYSEWPGMTRTGRPPRPELDS